MFRLDGKKALVTGASGGLGEGIVEALMTQGAQVMVTGTRPEALERLHTRWGHQCLPFVCNLKDPHAVDGLIPEAESRLGGLDILVNNAGLTRDNLTVRMKDGEFQEVLSVNLEAPFRLMRGALKSMIKQR
jgi:3-oxoacyl-[acyl-carrier protein] reductase